MHALCRRSVALIYTLFVILFFKRYVLLNICCSVNMLFVKNRDLAKFSESFSLGWNAASVHFGHPV